jgi:DNA-binding transcriptional LysR family regulator
MDWNDLRYFLAIARAGTLAGAARELGVEHTTVGRRLAALESALDVRLFTRGPSGLLLTEAGSDILQDVESLAEQVENIRRRVAGGDTRVAGTVRLTIPESGNTYFVQNLATLRERHPELLIEVLSDNRELDIRRGEADVAVRFRDTTDTELVQRKAGPAGWSLYASAAYIARKGPLASAEDLSGHDVIGFDASLSEITGALWLRTHARDANVVLRGNSISAVMNAACVGFGVAPLPCFTAAQESGLVRLTPKLIGFRDIVIAVHPNLARTARVRATVDFLLELFARDQPLWSGVDGSE